ncbi:MAG: META domain-containing protein, partial [Muribaculaceae bacterium]|nr:META domain-containing protein [Muribaculaceae bacterium]
MKLKVILGAIALMLTTVSCQTLNGLIGKDDTQQSIAPKKEETKSKFGFLSSKGRGKKKSKSKQETQSEENTDKSIDNSEVLFSKADSLKSLACLAGEWYFETVGGIDVVGEENRPTIEFEEGSTRFYATNGCNFFNGKFELKGLKSIEFDDVIATAALCEGPDWESIIAVMWDKIKYWDYNGSSEKQLIFKDGDSRVIATVKRHALESLNGLWNVSEINGRQVPPESLIMVIDLREKHVHGNTGCNLFNGTIYQDPDCDGSVQFQDMKVSKMACDNLSTETAFLVALEEV